VPAGFAGAVKVICEEFINVTTLAILLFATTLRPDLNPCPLTVIVSPPAVFAEVCTPGYTNEVNSGPTIS
jgi:hypothetical protein